MGFPARVRPYPLTAQELVYTLAKNPYIIPYRTFAAYGSVTEPFVLETKEVSLSYIATVYRWLRLPSQVSTKMIIDDDLGKRLREAEPNISVLVTIVTLDKANELERFAPHPLDRLRGAQVASKYNLSVYLFIRPIIPSVTDRELIKIISLGAEYGVKGVVAGSLRITNSIIQRLKNKCIDMAEIMRRTPKTPKGSEQISIKSHDLIARVIKTAQDFGLKAFRSACMANIDSHNDFCYMCGLGPCGDNRKDYGITYSDIAEYLEYLGLRFKSIEIKPDSINIALYEHRDVNLLSVAKYILGYAARRKIILSILSR